MLLWVVWGWTACLELVSQHPKTTKPLGVSAAVAAILYSCASVGN
jgi:hypothetical protein